MAVEYASELVPIVASYLRKHGFAKTLSVFLRENGDAFQETDVADLETLYKLYISTQPNGAFKAKKPRTTKSENGPVILEGDKDGENASASLHANGGTSSEKKKKKKGDKKNVSVDLPVLEKTGKQVGAVEAKKTTKEGGSKKKKGGENIEGNDKGLKSECEKAFPNGNAAQSDNTVRENNVENHDVDGGFSATQQELAYSRKSSIKKKKKEQKEQECLLLQDKETSVANEAKAADNAQVLPQDDDMPKKKRKKSNDSTCKEGTEDGPVVKSASEVLFSEHTEKLDASKQPVNALKQSSKSVNELEGGEIGSKKKKHRKELSSQCAEGGLKEQTESELEESKKDDTDNMKHSGKKRKVKEYVDAGKKSNQDFSNLGSSPEKLKEVEGIADEDVEMHDSMFAKAKKKEETPNDKKTPTGALAFKRVEVEKVAFSDPRLSDNSYWAKDGAEEGYGAKAQEVLGLVRGRDFRHEKTKKKRGSYRGGIIGFESHSIKFENSDED